jgi:hypothetical protein
MRDKAVALPLNFLVVVILAICPIAALSGGPWRTRFFVLFSLYTFLFGLFIYNSIRAGYSLIDLPVLISIRAYLSFGLGSIAGIMLLGAGYGMPFMDYAESKYLPWTQALVILGMVSFWGVVRMVRSRVKREQEPVEEQIPARALPCALILALLGTAVRLYLFHHHMYGFISDNDLLTSKAAETQPLLFASDFGFWALIILGILKYQKPLRTHSYAFWGVFLVEVAWGAIGAAKGLIFRNILVLVLLHVIYRRKLPLSWVAGGITLAVLIFPAMDSYRAIVHGSEGMTIDSLSSIQEARNEIGQNVTGLSGSDYLVGGLSEMLYRFDLLPSAAVVVRVRDSGRSVNPLDTGSRIWMLPAFVLIPRLLWPSKPRLNEGQLMAELLGNSQGTSLAPTHFGDAYLQGGLLGEVFYCGLLGFISATISRKSMNYRASPSAVFIGVALYWTITSLESDVFQEFAGFLKGCLMLMFVAWICLSTNARKPEIPALPE